MLLTAALLAAGIGTVAADPLNNNRLEVPCEVDGEEYVFVINGEGVAGHIIGEGETGNIIPVQDTVTYRYKDPDTGEMVEETVVDQLGQFGEKASNKKGLEKDLKICLYESDADPDTPPITYEVPGLGEVEVVRFEIQAFFTPRGR
jgi:hypothetical protein